ncbi:MAG: radical SAM protein [Elusimicrobiales bacterium]
MNISEKLYHIYFEKNIPILASIELTRRCVNSCIHCYLNETQEKLSKSDEELSFSKIKDIFFQLKTLGTVFLNITGGEPLLRKDIVKIVKIAVEFNFLVKLFSSLNYESNIIESLYDVGLRYIDVSLYGRKDIHNLVTRSNSFDKTFENIKKAKELGFKITIKTPVMSLNINEIRWLKEFSSNYNLNFKIDPIITPRNNGDTSPLKYSISKNDIEKLLEYGLINLENIDLDCNAEYVACGAMKSVIAIDAYGNVTPCISLPLCIGNVNENKISDILKSNIACDVRKKLEIEPKKCIKCNYKTICSRCPGVSWVYAGRVDYVYKQACEISKKIYEIRYSSYKKEQDEVAGIETTLQ